MLLSTKKGLEKFGNHGFVTDKFIPRRVPVRSNQVIDHSSTLWSNYGHVCLQKPNTAIKPNMRL